MEDTRDITEQRQCLTELAAVVATELGDGWQVVAPEPDAYDHYLKLCREDGMELTIWQYRHDTTGKLAIRANLNGLQRHYHRYYGDERHKLSINVSATKEARQIAADIRRRLLPAYLEAYAEAERNQQSTLKAGDAARQAAEKIIEAGRGTVKHSNQNHTYEGEVDPEKTVYELWFDGAGSMGGSLEVHSDSASLKLHGLTPDQAELLICLIVGNQI